MTPEQLVLDYLRGEGADVADADAALESLRLDRAMRDPSRDGDSLDGDYQAWLAGRVEWAEAAARALLVVTAMESGKVGIQYCRNMPEGKRWGAEAGTGFQFGSTPWLALVALVEADQ